jgi:hypothetical protein
VQITIDSLRVGAIQCDQVTIVTTPRPWLAWHIGPIQAHEETPMPLDISLSTEQQVRLAITPMTPAGQPAPIDGEATWDVAGDCTLVPIDATSTWVVGHTVGDSVVTVSADADMGAGVVTIMDTATIHVASPMAANLGLSADQPVLHDPVP